MHLAQWHKSQPPLHDLHTSHDIVAVTFNTKVRAQPCYYLLFITMTAWWPRWRLKSPASRLFTQPFIQGQIKENIKASRHWSLCEVAGEFPLQRASNAENVSIWWRHHASTLIYEAEIVTTIEKASMVTMIDLDNKVNCGLSGLGSIRDWVHWIKWSQMVVITAQITSNSTVFSSVYSEWSIPLTNEH